jgi:hypothetical protein
LIVACVGIYRSGDQPYSPAAVKAAFSTIAIPVYICLALIIGGFVLDGFFPVPKEKNIPPKQYEAMLARLYAKASPEQRNSSAAKKRKLHSYITLVLLVLGSAIFLSYGVNPKNFDTVEINASMIKAMYVLLPCMAVPFGYGLFTSYYAKASMKKEIEQLKASGCTSGQITPVKSTDTSVMIIRYALLAVGIVILVYGFISGGTADVLTKAVNLCTECIGLG